MAKELVQINIQICSFDFIYINLVQQTVDSEIKNVNEPIRVVFYIRYRTHILM
jgi:hypothetical protein